MNLIGPKLKIERANGQIEEVRQALVSFQKTNPYIAFVEPDPSAGKEYVKVRRTKEPPEEILVVIGEVLHNLRSALDIAIQAAASRNGVRVMERSGFPIEATEQKFESALHKRKIQSRLPALAAFLREIKPYERGNPLLWRLHILNCTDKHKVLVPIAGGVRVAGAKLSGMPVAAGMQHTFSVLSGVSTLDGDAVIFSYPLGMNMDGEIEITADIAFRNIPGTEMEPVVPTLHQFRDMASGILGAIETRFF